MTFVEINQILVTRFPDAITESRDNAIQPFIVVKTESLTDICRYLHEDSRLYFDYLACVTAIDNGPGLATMEVIYNLTSIPYGHDLMLKIIFPRNQDKEPLPVVPSVSHIWRTAEWHEREAFDLLGIYFEGNKDLRRILLPEDWEGHPLRKDYSAQEKYHGISVRYEDGNAQ
ncbi:NAD(P)H-quinone oxidoreductase subunit J [Dyadobacter sp. CECT 9275]|uniref:NADH-quinone oxidoreductase subunit C n=1 Tax=Dyadobacter helix TaxID=2822344 RepID=A0A916J9M9_9BACT|nr:NADH-quinone oxidoreductase subunit C [Dyadobacter sp. CECT 9275]CAG4994243.1 NAD(P)H-quinone oxidoreductase subunit J [Dyadobacter sp. CECT 9275]